MAQGSVISTAQLRGLIRNLDIGPEAYDLPPPAGDCPRSKSVMKMPTVQGSMMPRAPKAGSVFESQPRSPPHPAPENSVSGRNLVARRRATNLLPGGRRNEAHATLLRISLGSGCGVSPRLNITLAA
jgi:hypothetical protein